MRLVHFASSPACVSSAFCAVFALGCSSGGAPAPAANKAAAPDAAMNAGAGDGGPDGSCNGTFVCDSFDTYTVSVAPPPPWTVSKTIGTVTVDTTHAFSGTQSIEVSSPALDPSATSGFKSTLLRFVNTKDLPPPGDDIFGRMMFWLDSAPDATVHWTFVDGEGLVPNDAGVNYHAVVRYGGQYPVDNPDGGFGGSIFMASYDTPDSYNGVGPSSDCYQQSNGETMPMGQWACAEWEFDGSQNVMHFWLNGTELTDLTVDMTGAGCTSQDSSYVWQAPNYTQLDVGWESYQADGARTIWLDDVAFGPARIGCPAGAP
jgi:hypothetical protein